MNASVGSFFERVSFWQRLKHAMILFCLPLMLAAIIPATITILFSVENVAQAPNIETKPIPEFPKPIPELPKEPSSEDISSAWDAVRASDDIVLVTNFALKFPDTPFADYAWKRIGELVKAGGLKFASLDDNVEFIATIIEHKDKTLPILEPILDQIVKDHDLESKYPLGFAIFYADGHKFVNYGAQKQSGNISFDPSALTITFRDKFVCLDELPVRINGKIMSNFTNVCFGGNGPIIHAVRFGNLAALDIEPLGESQQGLAWVIGMRP